MPSLFRKDYNLLQRSVLETSTTWLQSNTAVDIKSFYDIKQESTLLTNRDINTKHSTERRAAHNKAPTTSLCCKSRDIMAADEKTTYPRLPAKLVLMSTKSYFSPEHTVSYLRSLLQNSSGIIPIGHSDVLFGLIPDFLSIYPCAQVLSEYSKAHPDQAKTPHPWPVHLGAQDCFWSTEFGAYTGEIVPPALKSLGVTIVELGHAERRRMLAETDETAAKKAAAASKLGMIPLVCIGEIEAPNLEGPMSAAVGKAMKQLDPQILSLLEAVPHEAPVIFAYEPVWAIGAAQPAGVEYVGPVVQAIRQVVQAFSTSRGRTGQTKVVYGGSAGPGLWSGKTNGGNPLGEWVDGMFLGRFAHKIEGVKAVVDEVVDSMK